MKTIFKEKPISMQAAFTYKLAELYKACSQESGTLQVRSQRWSFDRNRSIWKPPRRNSWFVSTRKENKQYLIPLDVQWTHSNVVAYGLGEDALRNRKHAIMFLVVFHGILISMEPPQTIRGGDPKFTYRRQARGAMP